MDSPSSNTGFSGQPPTTLAVVVVRMAAERPDAQGFFSRHADGWRGVSYREFYGAVSVMARWLLDRIEDLFLIVPDAAN